MNQITVTGMVLAVTPVGEYDRRVVILTKERGKVAAFARGSRKPSSALVGVTAPFSFGEFSIYEGRTSYTLMSASISNYFSELRSDMEGAYYGFYFLDLANYYAKEGNDETELLKLLYQTLRALRSPKLPNRLVRCIYELKCVSIGGEAPQVFECIKCADKERKRVFSVRKGGVLCTECMHVASDGVKLLPSTLYTMQYIISSKIERLYSFVVTREVLVELEMIVKKYLEEYVEKKFKSSEILEAIVQLGTG